MDFNERAKNWDSGLRSKRAELIADEIYKRVRDLDCENFKVLEFGCGTGLISFCLKDKFKIIDLFDTSEGMKEVLKSKIKESNLNNMMVLDSIDNDAKYDVIYSSMVMHHIVDVKKTIDELFELLNDDGCLCIVDLVEEDGTFHKAEENFIGHNGFNVESFENLMRKTSLKEVSSEIFYHGEKEVLGEKAKYSLFIAVGRKWE